MDYENWADGEQQLGTQCVAQIMSYLLFALILLGAARAGPISGPTFYQEANIAAIEAPMSPELSAQEGPDCGYYALCFLLGVPAMAECLNLGHQKGCI
ncbi:hypothetical protein AAVH_16906 [Aphelenchoides avenae]|nr:hypothetical protein AAVH_16906 [Aphelenchus avenae]